ncbi:helix-turn-helix domain-containing protein [Paenibacillus glycanilyticus]|uniref:helix-turn-helix domain-containing protein n=1 Tax=Paenibacillus glycanilyticus TaxID=126569 RepID=UPI0024E16E70|nr:helix-turn-helix transcriptional regulator [Paenibacillus glycanilyticus]
MADRQWEHYVSYPNSKSEAYLYGAHSAAVPAGWACGRHLHHLMFELNLVLEGTQLAEISGIPYRQETGDLLLVPPMRLHSFRSEAPLRYFVFHVQIDDPAFLQRLADSGLLHVDRDHPLNGKLVAAVKGLQELLAQGASRIRLYRSLYETLDLLESELNRILPVPGASEEHLSLPARIAREIEAYVAVQGDEDREKEENWMESIARRLGYSRRHCYRAFMGTFQMSPRDYLFVLRQQEAMHLLLSGGETLERIAIRIGYDNVQSFIRQFSKWTGTTPGQFRKQKRDELVYLTRLEVR